MALVVVVNSIQVVVDAEVFARCQYHDDQDACSLQTGFLEFFNWIYLCFYIVELLLKLYCYHAQMLCNPWNIFDITIVATGIITQAMGNLPSVGILRLLRLMRLAKALRLMRLPTELHIMFQGFFSALTAISFGVVVVGVMLVFWAVVGVVLIAPVSRESNVIAHYNLWMCESCKESWTSIWDAVVTLFGLLLYGEGWESMIRPLVQQSPFTLMYFTATIFTVCHGMVNLILAVIVDKASQVHVEEAKKLAKELHIHQKEAMQKFTRAFQQMDDNHDGTITRQDLLDGYDRCTDIRDLMSLNGIQRHDLTMLYDMVNRDNKDAISLVHFAQEVLKVKDENVKNVNILVAVVKQQVKDLRSDVGRISQMVSTHFAEGSISSPISIERKSSLPTKSATAAEKKDRKLFNLSEPLDSDSDVPVLRTLDAEMSDLRQQLHAQAREICDNLEKQARLLLQSERLGAEFAAALQKMGNESVTRAKMGNEANELVGREDPPIGNADPGRPLAITSSQRTDERSPERHRATASDQVRLQQHRTPSSDQAGTNALANLQTFSQAYASIDRTSAAKRKMVYDF